VSSYSQVANLPQINPTVVLQTPAANWYAIQTRSRHERVVAHQLQNRGIGYYLPVVTEEHRWSDRRKKVEMPLFSGYVFVQVVPHNQQRVNVLRIDGVVRFVGPSAEGTPIPDDQIESIRMLVDRKTPFLSHPFLKAGQRIRVRGGALDGVEGIFQCTNGENTLVVSIDAIQRSLSVSIKGYNVEPV
jgi:transcriptional antiterminator NusG